MVADSAQEQVTHAAFRELPEFLSAGDLVVVNVSETLPAAVAATASRRHRRPRPLRHAGAKAR